MAGLVRQEDYSLVNLPGHTSLPFSKFILLHCCWPTLAIAAKADCQTCQPDVVGQMLSRKHNVSMRARGLGHRELQGAS